MIDISNKIRDLFLLQNSIDKKFLGGIPYSSDIERQLRNHELYLEDGLPDRLRVNMGKVLTLNEEVIGYTVFTIFRGANPVSYERENIGLKGKLDYLQFRGLLVNSEFRMQGIGAKLGKYRLDIAEKLELPSVCDINIENKKNYNLLKKQGFRDYFNWKSPSGTEMLRLIHE